MIPSLADGAAFSPMARCRTSGGMDTNAPPGTDTASSLSAISQVHMPLSTKWTSRPAWEFHRMRWACLSFSTPIRLMNGIPKRMPLRCLMATFYHIALGCDIEKSIGRVNKNWRWGLCYNIGTKHKPANVKGDLDRGTCDEGKNFSLRYPCGRGYGFAGERTFRGLAVVRGEDGRNDGKGQARANGR